MVLVMTPGLIGGLVVAYPAVACRLIETQTDFCWIFFRLDGNPNQKYHSWSFSFPSPHLVNWKRVLFCSLFPFWNGTTCLRQILTIRSYFRELDIMKEQLLDISFDATRSACCDQNHVDPTGAPMLCDRRVVKECVKIWFGSQEAFEDAVRSEVLDMLMVLLSDKVFTNTWILSVTTPFVWTFLDLSASFVPFPYESLWEHTPVALLTEGLVFWLLAFPSVKDLLIMFCMLTRAKGRTPCIEIFKNLMVALTCGLFLSILLALYVVTRYVGSSLTRALAWSGGVVVFSIVSRLGGVVVKVFLKHRGSGI